MNISVVVLAKNNEQTIKKTLILKTADSICHFDNITEIRNNL